ncbi:helix-turn-helix domain-containing protein [Nonomuraea sp. NPDC050404]|uniref:helix-turn-helix domain-containing protein n=1 Tax=Nonomuraea sp. NPDC050404 TaxID=3155783 RepID=UPI0034041190
MKHGESARLLTPKQVGELWGVSEWTVRRHIASGALPYLNIAPPGCRKPRTRIRESDAVAYIDSLIVDLAS